MDVHKKIRELRKSKDLTQLEFSEMIGVKRNSLTQIELGKSKPTYEVLKSIVSVFGVDANIFFDFDDDFHPDVTDFESAHSAVKKLTPDIMGYYNFHGRYGALKPVLSTALDYEALEKLHNEINKTGHYFNRYHSLLIDEMINSMETAPPYFTNSEEFKSTHSSKIKTFKKLLIHYAKAIKELETVNYNVKTDIDTMS